MISPLGIFDSGIGGFSVLQKVLDRHGNVPYVYLGDTARVPYGEKSPCEIRAIAREIVAWLLAQQVSAIIVACNTTNSLALDVLEDDSDIPIFGLIKAACSMIKEKRIGVLATPATALSHAYRDSIQSFRPGTFVLEQGWPELVPLIEMGDFGNSKLRQLLLEYLKPFLKQKVEAIVLGCSHYPFIQSLIEDLLPEDIRVIDPALGLAKSLDSLLGNPIHSHQSESISTSRICVTSDPSRFATRSGQFLREYSEIELISLRSMSSFF